MSAPGAPHLCALCGQPQPLRSDEDYFAAFSTPRLFELNDLKALEKRFYELSRLLHPDRFSALGANAAEAKKNSLERMSFLNQAYSTLKNSGLRREYLLKISGFQTERPKNSQIPMELAESWFDLQDTVMEAPETASEKISQFEAELRDLFESSKQKIISLEKDHDAALDESSRQTALSQMDQALQRQSYLVSMERDVQRLKGRMGVM